MFIVQANRGIRTRLEPPVDQGQSNFRLLKGENVIIKCEIFIWYPSKFDNLVQSNLRIAQDEAIENKLKMYARAQRSS